MAPDLIRLSSTRRLSRRGSTASQNWKNERKPAEALARFENAANGVLADVLDGGEAEADRFARPA